MLTLIYPLLSWVAINSDGWAAGIGLPFNLIVVPVVDYLLRGIFGRHWDVPHAARKFIDADGWMIASTGLQFVMLFLALDRVSEGVSAHVFFGLASTIGIASGCLCITAAHELVHRKSRVCRGYGLTLLASVLYMHFRIDHVYGHHRHVGTPKDLATPRDDDTFFTFFNRVLTKGWSSAWTIEVESLRRRNKPAWTLSNRMFGYAACQLTMLLAIVMTMGFEALGLFVLQSFIAVHLLEATNYVQHFGASVRREGQRGSAEQCWDSDFVLSNLLLFNVPKHGMHHEDASAPFQKLKVAPSAGLLPMNFHLMVFAALIPPLWRKIASSARREVQPAGG